MVAEFYSCRLLLKKEWIIKIGRDKPEVADVGFKIEY
jgi:hypothetical protein